MWKGEIHKYDAYVPTESGILVPRPPTREQLWSWFIRRKVYTEKKYSTLFAFNSEEALMHINLMKKKIAIIKKAQRLALACAKASGRY